MDKKLKKTINNAGKYVIVNQEQVFIIKSGEEEFTFCNLKTLNYLKNELKLDVEILFNIYQDRNQLIYDMF